MHNFSEEFLARPEYQVIKAFVQDPDVSPAEAVQRLLRVREVLHREGREPPTDIDGTHTWIAMVTVVDLVSLTPAAQQHKFIEFIDHLQRTKVIDPVSGEEPTAVDMKLWTELPYLGVYLRDMYFFKYEPEYAQQVDDDPRREYPPSELQEWENRNAFMAQLTAKADHLGHTIDASLYALWACRETFEECDPLVEEAVRISCIWYIYASQRMWENCQVRRTFGDADNPSPRQRFTMKKWYHWRNGLKAAQLQFPRASTQEMIQKALTEIEKAEHGSEDL
ncbi:hypothetical protein AnigIFM59636_004649 [Aspergillus niger]|uniref:Contig An03c0080, genomic contig n=3 Tax=Aspergillus niger TaxID=5061 RepID=A2QGC6_ASPNC|nr:uncharacterized protein An03g02680 [Aspergillus niger]XP_025453104.1 uncharacterized protein BO96DRAFT_341244 [Aspergillus niger CBS 101883]RDH19472.1 hypothetical protein M747DRAFT_59099 [Aspergillus niger ATCC 13496]KAI2883731.1 hypothetical protein CBS13152_8334 [Aspergillus niger]KAI2954949.1 hypothetical protein CBS147322_3633 [Aspergillus niger]KAI3001171.1 hypothetical protein CBS147345_8674 [Aspergillus niger]PYH55049.1 hypothetical protein BO96DRAFT_341244 [Aspergillus niger CBS 1|eukprot:XP_001390165.1 hypothetical protein ANI_1_1194034 [Aspergillus niger CBS 513.88]